MLKKEKTKILVPISIIIITAFITFCILTTYSLDEYTLNSPIYTIEEIYIKNISQQTDISTYFQYFNLENYTLKVVDQNNEQLMGGYIYTGSVTQVYNKDNELLKTYTNIVKGEANNDGIVDLKDINTIASKIINNKTLEDYYIKAIDMNNDDNIKANDIALLNYYLNQKYESLDLNIATKTLMSGETIRLIPTLSPNIVLNQNLNWTSTNQEVAIVNKAGLVTAKNEGQTTITATTQDGTLSTAATITVDNTIKLSSSKGNIYIGGEEVKVFIKSIDYNDLTCVSSNEQIATCKVIDKYLIVSLPSTTTAYNDVVLTVTSPNYGSATYTVTTLYTYLNLIPSQGCISVNSLVSEIISSFDAGNLSFEISDTNIIKSSYVNANRFYIQTGKTAGDATVTIVESNGYTKKTFYATVYNLSLNKIGAFGKVGEDIEQVITAENTGLLSCSSEKEEVATCVIEENILKVTPLSVGESNITITENKCNSSVKFLVVVEGEE